MQATGTQEPPVLPAYNVGDDSTVVWCVGCVRWHWHGRGDGHRVAHCYADDSPYRARGYELKTVGCITEKAMKAHEREEKYKARREQRERERIYAQLWCSGAWNPRPRRCGTYKRLTSLVTRLRLLQALNEHLAGYEVFYQRQGEEAQIPARLFLDRAVRWLSPAYAFEETTA